MTDEESLEIARLWLSNARARLSNVEREVDSLVRDRHEDVARAEIRSVFGEERREVVAGAELRHPLDGKHLDRHGERSSANRARSSAFSIAVNTSS